MTAYRKLIVAIIGVAVMLANQKWGFTIAVGVEETLANLILGVLTTLGVFGVANQPPSS